MRHAEITYRSSSHICLEVGCCGGLVVVAARLHVFLHVHAWFQLRDVHACTSKKRVFGRGLKSHPFRFGSQIGINDRHRSRFVPPGYRSRFISEHPSRFVASTGTNAPVRGTWRSAEYWSRFMPRSGTKDPPLAINKSSSLPFALCHKFCWIVCEVWVLVFSFDCTQDVRRNV
jgi:hypothetical protein